eukprot:scaffold2117_cov241-Pinguiococcus_pyrenoidosus.AAC.12
MAPSKRSGRRSSSGTSPPTRSGRSNGFGELTARLGPSFTAPARGDDGHRSAPASCSAAAGPSEGAPSSGSCSKESPTSSHALSSSCFCRVCCDDVCESDVDVRAECSLLGSPPPP